MFTVEVLDGADPSGCQVHMFLDHRALKDLLKELSAIVKTGDHSHFFDEACGGGELIGERVLPDSILACHLKITLVD